MPGLQTHSLWKNAARRLQNYQQKHWFPVLISLVSAQRHPVTWYPMLKKGEQQIWLHTVHYSNFVSLVLYYYCGYHLMHCRAFKSKVCPHLLRLLSSFSQLNDAQNCSSFQGFLDSQFVRALNFAVFEIANC